MTDTKFIAMIARGLRAAAARAEAGAAGLTRTYGDFRGGICTARTPEAALAVRNAVDLRGLAEDIEKAGAAE